MQQLVDLGPGVLAGFTNRWGGASQGNYRENNLGAHVGDDPADVAQNRTALAKELGAALVFTDQVHGIQVHTVAQHPTTPITLGEVADGQVTKLGAVSLIVMVADCIPVLLADSHAGVIGVAHAGREGLRAGIIQQTVAAMKRDGARPGAIQVALGPAICGRHYEVPEVMATQFEHQFPGGATVTVWDSSGLDLRAGAHQVLTELGISHVTDVANCTYEDHDYFSHRRDGSQQHTGRFVGFVKLVTT